MKVHSESWCIGFNIIHYRLSRFTTVSILAYVSQQNPQRHFSNFSFALSMYQDIIEHVSYFLWKLSSKQKTQLLANSIKNTLNFFLCLQLRWNLGKIMKGKLKFSSKNEVIIKLLKCVIFIKLCIGNGLISTFSNITLTHPSSLLLYSGMTLT